MNKLMQPLLLVFALCTQGWAAEFPRLNPGLWQITTATSGDAGAPVKTSICIDQAAQQDMLRISLGLLYKRCSKSELRMEGDRAVSQAVCKVNQSTATIRGSATFSGTAKYVGEVLIGYEPPSQFGEKTRKVTNEAQFVGPCKPGQKAGDFITPDGTVSTMRKILDAQQ